MSEPRPKRNPPNLVQAALRKATNRPPRACCHTLGVLASYADHDTGRNIFVGVPQISEETGHGDRQPREHLQRLRDGHWIDYQDAPDEGRAAEYYAAKFKDPRHRPPVYRMVLETLTATTIEHVPGGPFKGCGICNPKPKIKGCGNSDLRAAESDTEGLRPAATNRPSHFETSSLRSTDSLRNESLSKKRTPHRAGGSDFSDSDPAPGWLPPTDKELMAALDYALKLLDQSEAISSDYGVSAYTALETLTKAEGGPCLECALLLPWWIKTEADALKGLNVRDDLSHLWGKNFGRYMSAACSSAENWSGLRPYVKFRADLPLTYEDRLEAGMDKRLIGCEWCDRLSERT